MQVFIVRFSQQNDDDNDDVIAYFVKHLLVCGFQKETLLF
jgi:hypothetical protein